MSAPYTAVIGGRLKLKRPVSTDTTAKSRISSIKPASHSTPSSSRSVSTASAASSSTTAAAAAQTTAGDRLRSSSQSEQSAAAAASSGEEAQDDSGSGGGGDKRQKTDSSTQAVKDSRTKAERDFEEAQAKREAELIRKKISKSHRQAIDDYNSRLAALTEHNDIPRVGPG